ncbi:Trehalose-6-P synthase/phosphatase complex synthase subunit, partial [Clydaea vesicula]
MRLFIVSNRLPVTITKTENGWNYKMSSGGLITALEGLKKEMSFIWIGWPGLEIPAEQQEIVKKELWDLHSCIPVFISNKIADAHYNGFSNSILWPLFHYHPGEIDFNEAYWNAYQIANQAFADSIMDQVEEGDLVWAQDYHLFLLPKMLREQLEAKSINVKIGFFLHTPFPSSEIYRILPVRREILLGVLHCNLIGFHTYDYCRHFLSSCTRILGVRTMPNGVEFEGTKVHVGTFPIGIDPIKFSEVIIFILGILLMCTFQSLKEKKIQERIASLQEKFKGYKLLVGVDRLDYIKGVPQKLHALENFLTNYPEWQGKVVLVQVAVPSREGVADYQHLDTVVNELVGKINGRFGTVEYMPIHYIYNSVKFDELVALYSAADACIITSTRDGMNLVSYEYICCQREKHGVLILSEFTGAAQSLNGAIIVNPWNTEELTNSIYEAVTMPEQQKAINHKKLYNIVTKYTAAYWGGNFVKELQRVCEEFDPKKLLRLRSNTLVGKFRDSTRKKIIFLDYDGTLNASHKLPEFSKPSSSVVSVLKALTSRPDVFVYILSGRSRFYLDKWFADTGVGLSAEHGCFYKHPKKLGPKFGMGEIEKEKDKQKHESSKQETKLPPRMSVTESVLSDASDDSSTDYVKKISSSGWFALVDDVDLSYRDTIRPLLQYYTDRTPGSFIEEKEINLTWHYSNADPEFGSWQAADLQVNLEKILSHMAVSIILGNKTLELRPSAVDKGAAAKSILRDFGLNLYKHNHRHLQHKRLSVPSSPILPEGTKKQQDVDFLLCIGDGKTDEIVFQVLIDSLEESIVNTCTVGKKQTLAKYYVE